MNNQLRVARGIVHQRNKEIGEPLIEIPLDAIHITDGEPRRAFVRADKFIEIAERFGALHGDER